MIFDERLKLAQERLGLALNPAARAERAGRAPGIAVEQAVARATAPAPAAPADPYAGEAPGFVPAGMVPSPEATNFGRLSMPRTDVPRFVLPGEARPGLSPTEAMSRTNPGIDVRSYTGSMWNGTATGPGAPVALAAAARPTEPPAMRDARGIPMQGSPTGLPVGNIAARDALLRSQFPNASRAGITALGNMAWNRPEEFNAAMAGTRLDPVAQRTQRESDLLGLATQRTNLAGATQRMQWAQEDRPAAVRGRDLQIRGAETTLAMNIEEMRRRAAGDAATGAALGGSLSESLGVDLTDAPREAVMDIAQFAAQRAEAARRAAAAVPKETTVGGRPAVVSNGNVQFIPEPRPAPVTNLAKLLRERAEAEAKGDAATVQTYDQAIQTEISRPKNFWDTPMAQGRQPAPAPAPVAAPTAVVPARAPAPAAALAAGAPAQAPAAAAPRPTATAAPKPAPKPVAPPNAAAIEYLRANPSLAAQFDAKYGDGAAKRALGQ